MRAFIHSLNISNVRITFFDVTERPPVDAVAARLLFSKDAGAFPLLLDLVNLAPVETPNLVRNPSFELGLAEWNSTGFSTNGRCVGGRHGCKADECCLGNAHAGDTA